MLKAERLSDLEAVSPDPLPGDPGYDYFKDFNNISASMLKVFAKSRRQYEGEFVTQELEGKKANEAMNVGSVCHEVLLEGKDISDVAMRYPADCFSKSNSLVSARAQKFRNDNDDIPYFLKPADWERCEAIIESVRSTEVSKWIGLNGAVIEQDLFWVDDSSGLSMRAKPDFLIELDNCVRFFDLKVTANHTPDDFSNYLGGNRMGSQRGWVQACHYESGIMSKYGKPADLVYVCVNPQPPFQVCVNKIAPSCFDMIRESYNGLLGDLNYCYRTGDWSEPWEGQVNNISLDQWQVC